MGFSTAPSRGSAIATGPSASTSRTSPAAAVRRLARDGLPVGSRASRRRRRASTRGRKLSASLERQDARRIGVGDVERPDPRAPQLLAVGVPEIGDQAADVRPRGAVDREGGAVALAPALLEAVHGDLALGDLDGLAQRRARS